MNEDKGRHAEAPERLEACLRAAIAERAVVQAVEPSAEEQAHASRLVHLLYGQSVEARVGSYGQCKSDNSSSDPAGSAAAVRASVCTVLRAVTLAAKDRETRVFCAIRPPGHHASVGAGACGFCLVNNVGVGMLEAYRLGFRRPAVVDFDLHLGDATNLLVESLNSRRSRLRNELRLRGVEVPEPSDGAVAFYASVHMDATYPAVVEIWHRSCRCLDAIRGPSMGYDCTATQVHRHAAPVSQLDAAFTSAFATYADTLARFKPDILFFSAGFDGHVEEHMCKGKTRGIGVEGPTYESLTRHILDKVGGGVPCISVLEGGYAGSALSDGLAHHLRALAADEQSSHSTEQPAVLVQG